MEASNDAEDNAAKKTTKAMYNALLKHPALKEYWTVLTEQGLLRLDNATKTFKTTEKGLRVIETYKRINDLINAQQQQPSSSARFDTANYKRREKRSHRG